MGQSSNDGHLRKKMLKINEVNAYIAAVNNLIVIHCDIFT